MAGRAAGAELRHRAARSLAFALPALLTPIAAEATAPFGLTDLEFAFAEALALITMACCFVPLLLVTLIAPTGEEMSLAGSLWAAAKSIGVIGLLIALGRYALDPMLATLARTRTPEVMSAAALDLEAVRANWGLILAAVPILMLLKGAAIYAASRGFRSDHDTALQLAFAMVQHGEFGFVLFTAAASWRASRRARWSTRITATLTARWWWSALGGSAGWCRRSCASAACRSP